MNTIKKYTIEKVKYVQELYYLHALSHFAYIKILQKILYLKIISRFYIIYHIFLYCLENKRREKTAGLNKYFVIYYYVKPCDYMFFPRVVLQRYPFTFQPILIVFTFKFTFGKYKNYI